MSFGGWSVSDSSSVGIDIGPSSRSQWVRISADISCAVSEDCFFWLVSVSSSGDESEDMIREHSSLEFGLGLMVKSITKSLHAGSDFIQCYFRNHAIYNFENNSQRPKKRSFENVRNCFIDF